MKQAGSVPYFETFAGEWASRYDEVSVAGHALRARRARLLELLEGTHGAVLDVGCGSAVLGSDILARQCQLWGVDASPRMIALCRKAFSSSPEAHFNVGDAMALPFASSEFDVVISLGVIDRLAHPERAIGEMARVLRPGGVLLLAFPNVLSPYALWRSHVYYPLLGLVKRVVSALAGSTARAGFDTPAHLWTAARSVRTLTRIVGDVQAVRYYSFGLLLSPLDEIFPTTALRVARRLEPLRDRRLRWLGAGFIVKAVKSPSPPCALRAPMGSAPPAEPSVPPDSSGYAGR